MKTFERLFKKIPVKYRWASFVVLAFFSFWQFALINSAFADKHHSNGWHWVLGLLSAAAVVAIFSIAATEDNK